MTAKQRQPKSETEHVNRFMSWKMRLLCSSHVRLSRVTLQRMQYLIAAILFIFALESPAVFAAQQTNAAGAAISTTSKSRFFKSNQSKVFYHDNTWWVFAILDGVKDWYLWKYDANSSTWTPEVFIHKSKSRIPDAVLNSADNQLYVILSHKRKPEFVRMSYNAGAWSVDSGFPQKLKKFKNDKKNPLSLVRANNGDLWVFAYFKNRLLARHSTDGGLSWSGDITIKSSLSTKSGLTDGVAFMAIPSGGTTAEGHVGVAYGEKEDDNSRFGFLVHRDSDPETSWSDESASLTSTGNERATNELNATVDATGQVYLLTQNVGAKGSDPANTLFKRATDGSWQSYTVNDANSGLNWFSPGIVVDANNNTLYLMGINKATGQGEYKTGAIGLENTLGAATAATLFATGSGSGDNFADLSVPATANIGNAEELFVCADNDDADDIWYSKIELQPSGDAKPPITVQSVTPAPNEANTNAAYTISLTLGDEGALTAGDGTMTLQFPNNTVVPGGIAANQIAVNGTIVGTANSSNRKVVITTPVNLANNANVSITFSTTAGLLNPSETGNFELKAWTSEQLTQATSPTYAISAATTSVSAAAVTPGPNTTGNASAYSIDFNLGAKGRLASGISAITIIFDSETTVTDGSISGAQVNGASASATGSGTNKTIILTAPSSASFNNGGAVAINLPASAIINPSSEGDHTLSVATSVEPSPVTSNSFSLDLPPPIDTTGDDNPISGSGGDFDKPNQNRPFFHDGFWWVAAKKSSDNDWYLWKLTGNTWSAEMKIDAKGSNRPDCVVDSPSNTLYILMASTSSSGAPFLRFSYSGGAWNLDSGFPVKLSSFKFSGDNVSVLTKAANGDLWAFNYIGSKIDAKKSSDNGQNWTSTITVKSGVGSRGLLDAVTFTGNGNNYVGVGYGENTSSGSVFGFLRHKDGDSDSQWTDETGQMPQPVNANSDDHIAMTVSHDNDIYFVYKTKPQKSSANGIGLFKRSATGNWQDFTVSQGGGWTRPAVVVDETNDEVYVFWTEESAPDHGQYRKSKIGNESALQNAKIVDVFDENAYNNISVPAHTVTSTTGLLVCAENTSKNETWYALLPITGSEAVAKASVEVEESWQGVAVYPNPFNPTTTIRFSMKEAANVKLQIFNIRGQLVRTLQDGEQLPGTHERRWNARDSYGLPVATGLYFYRLQIGSELFRGRMHLVK